MERISIAGALTLNPAALALFGKALMTVLVTVASCVIEAARLDRDDLVVALLLLGSGLIDHSQKMTTAAMQIADMKVWAHRS